MTVKETIIAALQKDGYDMITACEIAADYIKELLQKPAGKYIYHTNTSKITIIKKDS